MKKQVFVLIISLALVATVLSGCKKEKDTTVTVENTVVDADD